MKRSGALGWMATAACIASAWICKSYAVDVALDDFRRATYQRKHARYRYSCSAGCVFTIYLCTDTVLAIDMNFQDFRLHLHVRHLHNGNCMRKNCLHKNLCAQFPFSRFHIVTKAVRIWSIAVKRKMIQRERIKFNFRHFYRPHWRPGRQRGMQSILWTNKNFNFSIITSLWSICDTLFGCYSWNEFVATWAISGERVESSVSIRESGKLMKCSSDDWNKRQSRNLSIFKMLMQNGALGLPLTQHMWPVKWMNNFSFK